MYIYVYDVQQLLSTLTGYIFHLHHSISIYAVAVVQGAAAVAHPATVAVQGAAAVAHPATVAVAYPATVAVQVAVPVQVAAADPIVVAAPQTEGLLHNTILLLVAKASQYTTRLLVLLLVRLHHHARGRRVRRRSTILRINPLLLPRQGRRRLPRSPHPVVAMHLPSLHLPRQQPIPIRSRSS